MKKKSKKSPYSFETKLNISGDTVVFLKRGKHKIWLFNIVSNHNGLNYLGFDVGHNKKELTAVGIATIGSDEDFNTMPDTSGLYDCGLLQLKTEIREVQSTLERVFNI